MSTMKVLSSWCMTKENIQKGKDAIEATGAEIEFQVNWEDAYFIGEQSEINKAIEYIQKGGK